MYCNCNCDYTKYDQNSSTSSPYQYVHVMIVRSIAAIIIINNLVTTTTGSYRTRLIRISLSRKELALVFTLTQLDWKRSRSRSSRQTNKRIASGCGPEQRPDVKVYNTSIYASHSHLSIPRTQSYHLKQNQVPFGGQPPDT
jgi:K+ transporter